MVEVWGPSRIFIGDLSEEVSCRTLIYEDDSKTKYVVHDEEDVEKHQEDLDRIYNWQRRNNMNFNTGKFQVLRYGRKQEPERKDHIFSQ